MTDDTSYQILESVVRALAHEDADALPLFVHLLDVHGPRFAVATPLPDLIRAARWGVLAQLAEAHDRG